MTSIYVGNLPFTTTEDELRDMFAAYGDVESARIITDRDTGRPRGFGFVSMNGSDAQSAIEGMNGKDVGGRSLRVNEAEDKPRGGARSGGGGRW